MAVHWVPQTSKSEKAELQSRSRGPEHDGKPRTERGKRRSKKVNI